jgi:hypothetical protein
MATRDHDADGARLADALAAEFGREATTRTSITGTAAVPTHRPSRTPWVIAAVSIAVIAVQIPSIRASLAARPSLHAGVDVEDAGTQACIDELWKVSALVRQGASAETLARLPLTEPLTHARYAVTREGDALVVACPNPTRHGLTRLRITDAAPMPEASR